jgi:hypothetical protein
LGRGRSSSNTQEFRGIAALTNEIDRTEGARASFNAIIVF